MKVTTYLLFIGFYISVTAQQAKVSNISALQLRTIFQPDKQGVIRGTIFNLSMKQIQEHERASQIYSEDSNYIAYTVFLNQEKSEFADIYYDFDEKGLYSITVETFLDNSTTADDLFNATLNYFTDKFGAGIPLEDGYTAWKATAPNGSNYEIAIINISAPEDAGLVFEFYVVE